MSDHALRALKGDLTGRIADALKLRAMSNRGTFPPFRLTATAEQLVDGLLTDLSAEGARTLGADLGRQGLGLPALLEAQTAALETITGAPDVGAPMAAIGRTSRFFSLLLEGFIDAQAAESERQRVDMERAHMKTVAEQREQEALLRSTIRELSSPIIPVYEGILVLPLVGSVDSRRATEVTERLLEAISAQQAEIVIIDITGVPVIDTSTANHLLMTTRAVNLLGSRVVLVGIGAEIAQTIVHIGIELHGLITLANLQAGIAYALGQIGLGIQPLNGRVRGAA
jgi:rsbT co-antagonist protein RsbR